MVLRQGARQDSEKYITNARWTKKLGNITQSITIEYNLIIIKHGVWQKYLNLKIKIILFMFPSDNLNLRLKNVNAMYNNTHTHTHTHTYIYIYIYIYIYESIQKKTHI